MNLNDTLQLKLELCNPFKKLHLTCKINGLQTILKGEIFLYNRLDTIEISVYNLSKPLKIILHQEKIWDVTKTLFLFGEKFSINHAKDSKLCWANLAQLSIKGYVVVGLCNNLNINFALANKRGIIEYYSYNIHELLDIFNFKKIEDLIEFSGGEVLLPVTLKMLNIREEII